QIVATIGPATKDSDLIVQMAEHQMDIVRLNFSHGTYDEHAAYIKSVRDAAARTGRRIPIIQDLSGPRVQEKEGHHIAKNVKEVVTEKDIRDLKFGLEQDVDYVVMSYVGEAKDVLRLKEAMADLGKMKPIIAKVERQKGVDNIDEIINVSNAIMIGRGDLGNEVPLEEIPFVEKMIIKKCKAVGKPVITATQMMISMVNSPTPTRAEVTDVVYAIMNGSDAVMLSEETAIGKYPLEVIKWMEKILIAAEKHMGKLDAHPLL
ncbi:MAG: pyruvate kinase, partial [Patescibacteria group bacterium]